MKKFIAWLKAMFSKPKPKPPQPTPLKDDIDIWNVVMHDSGGAKMAAIVTDLRSAKVTDGSPRVEIDIADHSYQPNDGHTDSTLIAFWQSSGKWYAAYLEWVRIGGGYVIPNALENVYHNPQLKPWPDRGTPCAFCILARNNTQRSNIKLAGAWPIDDDLLAE